MSGLFVTFEGGDGSGKTTQLERLAERLRRAGDAPVVAREPGGTPLAERIRALLLEPGLAPDPIAEALLFEAARADLVRAVLRPALEAGRVVLCDRFTDSTLAYQGGGRGVPPDLLAAWNRAATGGLTPALTVLCDVDAETAIERRRAAGRMDRIDRESEAFHARVRARFLELARAEPGRFLVLDAREPAEALSELVWQAVSARIPVL